MSRQNYEQSLARVLAHEGGYTDHPADPGGPTNFGITIHDYRAYVKPSATAADVKAMRIEEAKAIYRAKYWDALRCDELPAGVDYAVFDYGVNSGIARAKKVLQRVLGVAADGVIGEATMRAVAAADAERVIVAICAERLRFLQSLKTWPVFGKGWGRRVAEVKAAALAMAANAPVPPAGDKAPARAVVPAPKAAAKGSAAAAAAAGVLAAQQAHAQGSSTLVVAVVLAATAAAAAAAWAFWRRRRKQRQERPA
jgi:lysozyme family protein